jgi:hypothetical protein
LFLKATFTDAEFGHVEVLKWSIAKIPGKINVWKLTSPNEKQSLNHRHPMILVILADN